MNKIPFSDISFDQEEIDAVSEVLSSNWPSRGAISSEFEAAISKYLNTNVVVVNSGSSALLCALLAMDVRRGFDTIAVPDFTFIATASIPAILGLTIKTVDCDPETFNVMENSGVSADLFIDTDVAGVPAAAGYDDSEFYAKHGRYSQIEDAAEAFGAETIHGKVGSGNHLTCFSFNITKSLTTIEGGAIASKNEELIEKCRSASNYGRTKEQYVHDRLGLNCRITDVASALGLIQLRKLDKNLARRKEIADRYRKELPMFQFQKIPSYVTKTTNFMMIALMTHHINRNEMLVKLRSADIDAREPFLPISRQPCFPQLQRSIEFNNTDTVCSCGLCLPIFNNMTDEQVDFVIETANN